MGSPKLKAKQEVFCQEYLKDLNATQAVIRAGYASANAHVTGPKMLANVGIAARIQELMNKRAKKVEVTSDFVLMELLKLAKADLSKAYDEKGNLLPIHEIPEETRKAIAGIKVFEEFEGFGKERVKVGEVRELKFWDKTKSLELLGKHLGMFKDKIEHSGEIEGVKLIFGKPNAD